MTVFLLLVIVAILLFGAAFVRIAIVRFVLGVVAIVISFPLLLYPLKGLIWLTENPEWLMGVAIAALYLGFWVKMREINRSEKEMTQSWTTFAKAIEHDFTPAERESLTAIRTSGDAVAFRNACRQYVKAAETRKGPTKEQRRAMKSIYLSKNPR